MEDRLDLDVSEDSSQFVMSWSLGRRFYETSKSPVLSAFLDVRQIQVVGFLLEFEVVLVMIIAQLAILQGC